MLGKKPNFVQECKNILTCYYVIMYMTNEAFYAPPNRSGVPCKLLDLTWNYYHNVVIIRIYSFTHSPFYYCHFVTNS